MPPKRSTTTTTVPGLSALNGNEPDPEKKKPKKRATPVSGSPAQSTAIPTFSPSGSAPTSDANAFTNDKVGPQFLAGDNSDLLGQDPGGRRTIEEAVAQLHTMSSGEVAHIQDLLIHAGLLKGKYRRGNGTDPTTLSLWRSAVENSQRNGVSIGDYLTSLGSSDLAAATAASSPKPAKPSYTDPAAVATNLEQKFDDFVGRNPTQKELNTFSSRIANLETSRASTRVGVDVGAEATLFAQGIAAKSPGSARSKLASATDADITRAAAAMGVDLSATARKNIARQVTANAAATGSADENLLDQLVAQQFKMPTDPSKLSGDAATVYNDLTQLAGRYLIPAGQQSIGSWVTKAIKNQSYAGSTAGDAEAEYETWLRQQASIQMPWLAKTTNNFETVTPWDATSAYRTAISDTLQLGNPDAVNLLDPKYSKLIQTTAAAPPDLSSIRQTLMTDPTYGYTKTPLALQQAYALGSSLLKGMGVSVG